MIFHLFLNFENISNRINTISWFKQTATAFRCNDVRHPAEGGGRPHFYLLFSVNLIVDINPLKKKV